MAKENDGYTEHSTDFEKWAPSKKGDRIEGRYLGGKELPSDDGEDKTWMLFRLRTDDDRVFGFSGSNLVDAMAEVRVGHMCRVTYEGEKDLKKKGRSPMKVYKVESKPN